MNPLDIVERLEAHASFLAVDYDNPEVAEAMFEAAAEIRRLREQCGVFAMAVIELSDNVEDRDGLSDTTEYTVDAARAYRASEKE